MARIASESKGGFYATPEKEMQLVASRLRIEEAGEFNFYDPCCGKGVALRILSDHLSTPDSKVITYGVELEKERAEEARNILHHVLQDGYENVRTEDHFSALYLNPPYDDGFGERIETSFLRRLTNKSTNVLVKGALLMFCIPQYVLSDASLLIASRFTSVKVYRFTDVNYPTFKQVVVFGYFQRPDPDERSVTTHYLREVSKLGPEALPSLDEEDGVTYRILPSRQSIRLFRAGKLRIDEMSKDLVTSPIFLSMKELFLPSHSRNADLKNPVLPLKPTHYAIAIAAGAVGGNMGNHLLVGVTKQIHDTADKVNDDGEVEGEVTIKHHKSIVRVFTKDGVFDLE
ncbi:DUF6094 domain-containing protein [Brevibacillus reuszeri]|uniref:DUF6094 domain-containing protein n=1 Tax=Brevibacillus reuszeri TaxID=54915 RepID=UPI000CCC5421|nr:DUF6094 domain-containing protein [Brevibacillus reuszeri]